MDVDQGEPAPRSGLASVRASAQRLRDRAILAAALVAAMLALLSPLAASAQVYSNDPPHPMATDQNGVDLQTATPSIKSTTISIGPAKGGLSFWRTWRGAGARWTDITQTGIDVNWMELGLALVTSAATVSVGTETDQFPPPPKITWNAPPCTAISLQSLRGTGATLVYNCTTSLWTYTAHDGTIYTINPAITSYAESLPNPRANTFGSLVSIQKPDGEVVTYNYANGVVESITNNRGYQLKFIYSSQYSHLMTQVIAINNAVDYCNPTAATCAGFNGNVGPSGTVWPTVTYAYTVIPGNFCNLDFSSETDAAGNVTTYAGSNSNGLMVTTPAGLQISYSDGHQYVMDANNTIGTESVSSSVVVNGQTWQYNYTCDQQSFLLGNDNKDYGYYCSSAHTVRTDPAGNTYTINMVLMGCSTLTCQIYPEGGPNVQLISGPFLTYKATDELGRVTNYTADDYGRPQFVQAPLGNSATFTYDGAENTTRGNLITATNAPVPGSGLPNIVYSATYPTTCTNTLTCNEPTTTTDADGNVTSYTYDPGSGQILTKTLPADSNGVQPQTRYTYSSVPTYALNSSGTLVQVGAITELASTSQCTSGTAPSCVGTAAELLTTNSYAGNSNGLLTSTTKGAGTGSWALNLTTTYAYSHRGDMNAEVDPRGNETAYTFDVLRRKVAEGHLTGTSYPWLSYTAYTYDADSHPITEQHATGFDSSNNVTGWAVWQTSYTPTGKVLTKTDPLNDVSSFTYDALDRLSTSTDPTGYVTKEIYDAASQKIQEQRAVGTSIQQNYETFTYSLSGKVLTETDARNNAITYAYDGFDRLSLTTYADGTTEQNAYDPNGEITIWTNRAALAQIRCYDALGRKIAEKSVTGATNQGSCPTGGTENQATNWWDFYDRSFTYDLTGEMLTANSTSGWNRSYTYDAASRPLTLTDNLGTFTYGHDAADNLVSLQYPTGHVVAYVYDDLDRMTNASLDGTAVATLAWDVLSRRTSLTFGDGSSQAYGYDAADRLTSLTHVFPGETSANVTDTFGFDAASRLTSRATSNSAYVYSLPVTNQTYATANALNQYPTVNGTARSYWPGGQEYQDGILTRYYDQAGTFAYAVNGAATSLAVTDALGRAFDTINNNPNAQPGYPSGLSSVIYRSYGPERPEVVLDRTYTGAVNTSPSTLLGDRIYVLGPNPDERLAFEDVGGSVYYPHVDRQGSTIALSHTGASVLIDTYDAYGQPSQPAAALAPGASAYPWLYTGQRYDPFLAAYDDKARIYSALDGRFWQPDPIGPKDDINLYVYTHNDPVNKTDPSGEAACGGPGQPVCEVVVQGQRTPKSEADCLACHVEFRAPFANVSTAVTVMQALSSAEMSAIKGFISQAKKSDDKTQDSKDKSRESKPTDAPSGTKPIDQSGLGRGKIHDIKDQIGAGPKDWVGITKGGDVITTDPSTGKAVNEGNVRDF